MPARLRRTVRSFAIVFVAFWTYRLLIAPWIDPSFVISDQTTAGEAAIGGALEAQRERSQKYQRIFPPGSWELNDPIMLESEGVELLMKDYENLTGGKVRLSQCTMLYVSGDGADAAEAGRVVILRAHEGAILQFDAEMNLRRGKIGKLIGGELKGPVTIHGTPSKPGADDALYVATRDVQMKEREISSNNVVEFRFGPNQGHGRDLRIHLMPTAGGSRQRRGPNVSAFESIELLRDVQMSLQPGSTGLFPGDRNVATSDMSLPDPETGRIADALPVEIRCQGPFRFDLVKRQAMFRDQVAVHRPMGAGIVDQIACNKLQIFFGDRSRAGEKPSKLAQHHSDVAGTANDNSLSLQVERFVAIGQPATVTAPSNAAYVRGNYLEYEMKRRRVVVRAAPGQPEASLKWNNNEFGGRSLEVERPNVKALPLVTATGAGWFDIADPDDPSRALKAHWTRELSMRPEEGRHRVSLVGDAQTSFRQLGELNAGQIDLWLVQIERPGGQSVVARYQTGDNAASLGPARRSPARGPSQIPVTPARLVAVGDVRFDAPQLTGDSQQLDVLFDPQGTLLPTRSIAHRSQNGLLSGFLAPEETARGAASQPPSGMRTNAASGQPSDRSTIAGGTGAAADRSPAAGAGVQPIPAQRRFELHGNTIQVKLVSQGEQTEVNHVEINGKIHLRETSSPEPNERPMEVRGDWLQVKNAAAPRQTTVIVEGQPGLIAARGMEMRGHTINLDRGRNLLWINGAGSTVLPPTRMPSAQASTGPLRTRSTRLDGLTGDPVQIDFAGGMRFDGQVARFERQVTVHSQKQTVRPHPNPVLETLRRELKTDVVEVTLRSPVDFAAEQAADNADVETLTCLGPVLMTEQTSDNRGVVAVASITTRDLSVRQSTGEVHAFGPGTLKSTRLDSPEPIMSRAAAKPASSKAADEPVYMRVDYAGKITGNLHVEKLELHDDIRGVYGPVKRWDDELPLNPHPIGPQQILFSADKLIVRQTAGVDPKSRLLEVATQGNTRVDGQTFSATAHQLIYVQGKGQLKLTGAGPNAGDGHNEAILYYQPRPGGPQNEMRADEMTYWPETNHLDVPKARSIQAFDTRAPAGARNQPAGRRPQTGQKMQ